MGRLRRTMRMERLESRSLLAAALGIADVVVDQTAGEPQVATSIEINNAAGIRAATVEILYDQNLLQADLASVRAGSIWEGKGVAISNLNDEDGKITAFIFASEDMSLTSGSLLDIDFVFNEDTPANARAHVGLGSVRLNEGDIPISPVPMPGHQTIDGSITRGAGPAQRDAPAAAQSPLQPGSPPKPTLPRHAADTLPRETPQVRAPQRPSSPVPAAAPTAPPTIIKHQALPRPNGLLASETSQPDPVHHGSLHCAPASSAATETMLDTLAQPFGPLIDSPLGEVAVALAEYTADLPGPQAVAEYPAVGEPPAEAPNLAGSLIEKPTATGEQPAADSADALLATRAKPALEVGGTVRRSHPTPKTFSLFIGSPQSSRAGGFSEPLLWLLSHREPVEPQSDGEEPNHAASGQPLSDQ